MGRVRADFGAGGAGAGERVDRQTGNFVCRHRPHRALGGRAGYGDAGHTRKSVPRAGLPCAGRADAPQSASIHGCATASAFHAVASRVPAPASRNQGKAYQKQVQALSEHCPRIATSCWRARALTPGDAASVAARSRPASAVVRRAVLSSNLEAVRKVSGEDGDASGIRARDRRSRRLSGAAARGPGRRRAAGYRATSGISGARRIAALAETYYVAIAPRHDGGPVATAAAIHLAASVPNFFIQHVPVPEAAGSRDARRDRSPAARNAARRFLELTTRPRVSELT